MALIDVPAKKGGNSCNVQYDFGDDLASCSGLFGDEVVFTNARANMKIVLQAGLRRCLEKGLDPAEYAARFKPGVQTASAATDPVVAMKAKFATMDEEAKKAFLAELKASL